MNPTDSFDTALGEPVSSLSDGSLLDEVARIEHLGRLVDARRIQLAAEVADRSRFELGGEGLARRMGHARPGHLLEHVTRASAREVGARMSLGALTRDRSGLTGENLPPLYPSIALALTSGAIGADSARAIARALEQASRTCSPELLERAEVALVSSARDRSADLVAVQARVWRDTLDPDGVEPREDELRSRRSFTFGREVNGMARITIDASGVDLAELRGIFGAYASPKIAPRFVASDDEPGDALADSRTARQRDFDIFLGLVRAGSRSDQTRPGPRAAVIATTRAGSPVAWLDGVDEPVGRASIDELRCGGTTREAVVDARGALLSLGRSRRAFTEVQHTALAVRDGGCIWPHCTAPPGWCDAHHVRQWSDDGPTDVSNGALLCPAHHRLLHAGEFELRMADGVPELRAPVHLDPSRQWMRVGGHRALVTV